jgi:hypothetical protein
MIAWWYCLAVVLQIGLCLNQTVSARHTRSHDLHEQPQASSNRYDRSDRCPACPCPSSRFGQSDEGIITEYHYHLERTEIVAAVTAYSMGSSIVRYWTEGLHITDVRFSTTVFSNGRFPSYSRSVQGGIRYWLPSTSHRESNPTEDRLQRQLILDRLEHSVLRSDSPTLSSPLFPPSSTQRH